MARSVNRRRKRTSPRREVGAPSRWWKLLNALTALAAALLVLALVTVALSWGRPPRLGARIVHVEALDGGGLLLYGRVSGSFGPFRRGFGQWIGPGSLDLLTPEDRVHTLEGLVEETRWTGMLWPANWWRRELWFVEALPPTSGFDRVRVRLADRLGNPVLGPTLSLASGVREPEEPPADVRLWARFASLGGGLGGTLDAAVLELEAPRR